MRAQWGAARLSRGWAAARPPQAASEAHRPLGGRARAVPGGRALLAELPLPGRTVVTAGPASVLVLLPTATRRRARCHRVSPVYPGRFGPRAPPTPLERMKFGAPVEWPPILTAERPLCR